MNRKHKTNIYVIMRLLIQIFWVENEVQIKSGIMIYVDVSVKNKLYVKKIIFGILLNI